MNFSLKKRNKVKKTIGFQGWYMCQPCTGIGQHCIGLVKALVKQNKIKTELKIIVPEKVEIKGVPRKSFCIVKPKWWIPVSGLKKWYWERIQVPAYFGKINPDREHYPYPCPLPEYSPNLRSITVHDVILWRDARYKGNFIKNFYHKQSLRSLVYVDKIFTVSREVKKQLNIPSAEVIYNDIPEKAAFDRKKNKSKNGEYLVYIGGYDIRKNVPQMIETFGHVRQKNPELSLVLIGEPHHKSKLYSFLPEKEGVKKAGKVSDKKLYEILSGAFAFVHFSDSEGFNIPLLQAMKSGVPAIVRDIPVNREISGGSAIFMNSQETDLSGKINSLKPKKNRDLRVKKQKEIARRYSWDRSVEKFLKSLNLK